MTALQPRTAGAVPPEPRRERYVGHLRRWAFAPLDLLDEGARLGPVVRLQLWRSALVGYTPAWNRFVLGDLDTFRSKGSLSQLSPYLSAGIVATDQPAQGPRRAELNPTFHRRSVAVMHGSEIDSIVAESLPSGRFDAVHWSSTLVRRVLARTFLGRADIPAELASFVAPMDKPMPAALLRRPLRIRRINRLLAQAFADPPAGSFAELFASLDGGVDEARVALAAAYDTTAHTLTLALWELAARPGALDAAAVERFVDETLRMYPAGWIGSRVASADTSFDGVEIRAGQLVLYSPYLSHRMPQLWDDPLQFRPDRFTEPRPAWGYVPFAAGARTCLGASLAKLLLRSAVAAFAARGVQRESTSVHIFGGLTLTPSGPLWLSSGS